MRNLVCLLDLPNPLHGMSLVNKMMVDKLCSDTCVINSCPSFAAKYFPSKNWYLIKIGYSVLVFVRLFLVLLFRRRVVLYRPINGGGGQVFDIFYLILARIFCSRIYIHHHSFQYLNSKSKIFSALVGLIGRDARHIVLGRSMKDRLVNLYGVSPDMVRVVSNSSFFKAGRNSDLNCNQSLVIGHLANLCVAKGLKTYVDLCLKLKSSGVNFKPILAGPAHDIEAINLVDLFVANFGLDSYWGAVYGEKKDEFFSSLDAFLFMSEYENEAEPLVLYEAAKSGALIYSSSRGCMGDVTSALHGKVFKKGYTVEDVYDQLVFDMKSGVFNSMVCRERIENYDSVVLLNLSDLDNLINELES